MIAWLLTLFPSLISSAITAYNKSVDASVAKYKVDGNVNIAAIQAQAQIEQAQRDVIVAEQGHWLTRLPRPVMGLSAAAYIGKVLIWDMCLSLGSTPALHGSTETLVGVIIGGYFLHDTAKVIKR